MVTSKNQYLNPSANHVKKELNVEADFYDDALIFCVKN